LGDAEDLEVSELGGGVGKSLGSISVVWENHCTSIEGHVTNGNRVDSGRFDTNDFATPAGELEPYLTITTVHIGTLYDEAVSISEGESITLVTSSSPVVVGVSGNGGFPVIGGGLLDPGGIRVAVCRIYQGADVVSEGVRSISNPALWGEPHLVDQSVWVSPVSSSESHGPGNTSNGGHSVVRSGGGGGEVDKTNLDVVGSFRVINDVVGLGGVVSVTSVGVNSWGWVGCIEDGFER